MQNYKSTTQPDRGTGVSFQQFYAEISHNSEQRARDLIDRKWRRFEPKSV
jgi:hypothetical protein